VTPPIGSGRLLPIGSELISGYGAAAARQSKVREKAVELANQKLGTLTEERFIVEGRAA
jgi:hypothetical protein